VTEEHVCEQFAQSHYMKWNGQKSNPWPFNCESYTLTIMPHTTS